MQYTIGEYEVGQIKAFIDRLEKIYPESVCVQLRQTLSDALSRGFFSDKEIYELLELLPLTTPHTEPEKRHQTIEEGHESADWGDSQESKQRRLRDQIEQYLSHLLFMQSVVHKKNTISKGVVIKKNINRLLR